MHCVTLMRVLAPLLWQRFSVEEIEINLYINESAVKLFRVWFMTLQMVERWSIIVSELFLLPSVWIKKKHLLSEFCRHNDFANRMITVIPFKP